MLSISVEKNISLAPYTTFKIGGSAKYFFIAKTEDDLKQAVQQAKDNHIDYFVLGGGSNILISDDGFNGLVIKIAMNNINVNNKQITVDAGVKVSSILSQCKDNGLSGLEFLAGVPATIGGATWANAGSRQENMSNLVHEVKILDENNNIQTLSKADCNFSYRDSIFKNKEFVILSAVLDFKTQKPEQVEQKIKSIMEKKLATQDLNKPSIGSVFKNPSKQQKAWQLIDDVGLRGYQLGGAKISEKHANFIVNTGQATASDVIMLISLIKQKVRNNAGVQLVEEVEYIGF